jgi:hypothetical protein
MYYRELVKIFPYTKVIQRREEEREAKKKKKNAKQKQITLA